MATDAKVYVKGKAANIHEAHHHVMPVKTYLQVFGALLVLTVLTVLVSYADLGPFALGAAMFVALIKAGFVIGYFMHLKFDTRFHSFIFFGTLLFVGIFFVLTYFDLNTRSLMNQNWDTHTFARDQGITEKPPLRPMTPEEKVVFDAKHPHGLDHGGGHGGEHAPAGH